MKRRIKTEESGKIPGKIPGEKTGRKSGKKFGKKLELNLDRDSDGVSPVLAVYIMVAITILLAASVYNFSTDMSPEIYFHVNEPVTTDVTVEIEDGVTKTIPEVPMGKAATWKDVYIDTDGTVTYQGKQYPFLYYEGAFRYEWTNHGWLLEKKGDNVYMGNEDMPATDYAKNDILDFLKVEMRESGLLENEIDFVIHRIVELNMLHMDKPYMTINYIPVEDVDNAIRLTTSFDFSQLRRHFAFYEHDGPVDMKEPVYEPVEDTGFVIHETAVNKF